MSYCPYCNNDLSESPLSGGRCPTCGNMLAWQEPEATAQPPGMAAQQPAAMGAPAPEMNYSPPPAHDPLAALKATMARIVNRGVVEAGDGPRQATPTLLPPGAGMDQMSPAHAPLVAPPPPAQSPPSPTSPSSHPTPISPRSYPTPRGNIDQTVELGPGADRPMPAGDESAGRPTDGGAGGSDAGGSDTGGATIDLPAFKAKQPSTYDDRRIAQTMAAGGAAENTEQVAKLWRGTFDQSTTPRTSLKGQGAAQARDSKLVIKHRALREVREPARTGADYELLSVIGEGGMGVVYSARQAAIDRTVAIKMLKADIARDNDQREKFLSEAVVTGDLDHPNIVPIYDLGSNETGALFYSMKRVQGTPWMSVIDRKSNAENIDILMKVADAVAFAHSRGVIHRDLKPENVMLGDFGEVLVMDWGLALSTSAFRKSESITQTSSMGGTPAYMAPEMATGPIDRVGAASDVYLLGAILYEIIAKKPPHTGKNVMNCLFAAARNEIQPTEHSGELLDIAMKAMSTKLEDRFPSVQDLQAAIRQYQSHSESIVLSTRAQHDLEAAEKSGDYQTYSRALFAFQEAAALWDGNAKARSGVSAAKLAYARQAMKKEDFDLGASLVDPSDPAHVEVHRQIVAAQRERDTRQQRLKSIRRTAVAMGIAILVGATAAAIKINSEKNLAQSAEVTAREAEKQAQIDRDAAVASEGRAKLATKAADKSAGDALLSAAAAEKAKEAAVASEKQAKKDRNVAQNATQAEEYQAYVARIGLAAAQIDENAFDTAEQLLKDCPPPLRNWEWGRLRFLTMQSVSDFDGQAPVDSVAFFNDGKKFVSGGWDGKARVWDVATKNMLFSIPYGATYVHAVAVSPNRKLIATGGNDRNAYVKIWNAETGDLIPTTFVGHRDDVLSVAFSRDGTRLLTSSYDKTARLWDVATGKELQTYVGHNWWVWSAAFSRDESQIVTASQDGTCIVWSTESGKAGPPFTGHAGPAYAAAFSADGRSVVSGGYDNRVLIWQPDQVEPFNYELVVSKNGVNPPPKYRALEGHTGPVHTVAFSPNGKLVLSGSNDNTVKLWDFASGKLIKSLRGHGGWVDSAVFSPDLDSHWVLSGSHDNGIKLWNIQGYEEVRVLQGQVFQGHTDAVLSAAASRDGKRIVTASRDRTAKMWDAATGKLLKDFEEGHEYLASTSAFFPDGKRLLTAAADNTTRTWDLTTGTQLLRLDRTGRGSVAVLSHDGKFVLTGSDEPTAQLWNAATGELLRTTQPLAAEATAVAFSPDDKQFFVGDAHGHCTLWNSQTAARIRALDTHSAKITAAEFTNDGRRVLTASADRTVGQWDVSSGDEPLALILKHPGPVATVAVVPRGSQAITLSDDGAVRLWDVDRAEMLGILGGDEGTSQIGVSADGRLALWVNSKQRTVHIWNLHDQHEVAPPGAKNSKEAFLTLHDGLLWSAAFSPDAQYLITVGGNGARLWDMATGAERMSFTPNGAVASARFSLHGRRIVTGSWDNSAKIWNVETGRAELKLVGHAGYVNSAEFSPDDDWILTASNDKTARIWDAKTGHFIRSFVGHLGRVTSATFSTDGRYVLTASDDATARVWDARTAKQLHLYKGDQWGLLSAAFSRDGSRIITGNSHNTARIWDVETEKPLATLAGHTAPVTSVAFSPDGKRALTGSQDDTAKLWDAGTGKEVNLRLKDRSHEERAAILTLKGHTQEVTSVAFSDDGSYVLTASRDGTAIIWLAATGTRPNDE
jgi:WD40 repeat protein/serine/threonine protein kinase